MRGMLRDWTSTCGNSCVQAVLRFPEEVGLAGTSSAGGEMLLLAVCTVRVAPSAGSCPGSAPQLLPRAALCRRPEAAAEVDAAPATR